MLWYQEGLLILYQKSRKSQNAVISRNYSKERESMIITLIPEVAENSAIHSMDGYPLDNSSLSRSREGFYTTSSPDFSLKKPTGSTSTTGSTSKFV